MAAKKAKDEEAKKPKKAPASKSKETKAKAPAKEKATAKAKKEKAEVPAGQKKFSARSVMLDELAEIEKKSDLVSHGFGRYCKRLSTGVLAVDMYLDGGLIPGGWYTVAGPEQSAKSTLTMTLVAACVKQAFSGYGALFDYEGSSDIDYIMNMFRNFGIKNADQAAIFGVQDPSTGDYLQEGIFRYYDPDNGEKFFSYMSMMRRRLPDKIITEKGEPFLIFDNNKKNQKKLAGHYDPKFFREKNKFKVPAEDTSMQSLTVVDSYPAMLPDQMDDDDPSGAMALQARMFSDGIKRFRGGMRRKMMTILGVNQLRERPAQQHGDPSYEPCLIGSTRVLLANGSTESIKNIVDNKLDVEVMSFDKRTGEVSAKRIIDWKDNGPKLTSELVTVTYSSRAGDPAKLTATKNHKIWSDGKWVKAGDLKVGDALHFALGTALSDVRVVSVGCAELDVESARVYDLTVEDNHTYFAGDLGVAVSNCGNALKFYCVHNSTEVRYLDEEGDECVMSAREYYEAYAEVPREDRPPIRVPQSSGWLIPDEVFETDGSNFSVRNTYEMFTESGHVIRGSAGHSVLTATPLVAMHPWGDDDAACKEFDLPNKGQLNELEERKRDFSKKTMRIPRIGWSRLINLDARKKSFAFVDANGLSDKEWRVKWNEFMLAVAPELAEFISSVHGYSDLPIDLLMGELNEMSSEYAMEIIAAYASSDPEEGEADEYVTELYDIMFAQFAYIEELVNVYLQISNSNRIMPSPITSVGEASAEFQLAKGETYIDFSVGGSWISSGIVSHNSDVRIRVMGRAIPPAFKGERGVVEEPSVEFLDKKRVDRYKFVSGRTIKNKLGGIPNQEFWIRIWEADGMGNARGVDPVYDVYFYLKTLNLLGGQRNKIKFLDPIPLSKARRGITWQELKQLVLGTPSQIKELCEELDVKPMSLRSWCFKFVSSEQGRQMVRDAVVSRVTAEAGGDDDDDDDD